MARMSQRTVTLREYAATPGSELQVDPDSGWIKGVRVLGLTSSNGRTYLKEAVKKALSLYDGAKVYNDHPASSKKSRTLDELLGYLANPRLDPDGGVRADLRLLKESKYAPVIFEIAGDCPQLVGLSHNARGVERADKAGNSVIESIEQVYSVDLVTDPATTKSLKESHTMPTVRSVLEKRLAGDSDKLKALREMGEDMAGVMDAPMEDAPEEAGHEDAIYAAAKAVIDDESLSVADKLAKIKKLLALVDGEAPAGDPGASADAVTDDADVGEGKPGDRGNLLESLQLQLQVKDLLIDAGHRPGKVLLKALDACKTLQEAKELIAEAAATPVVENRRPQVKGRQPVPVAKAAAVPDDPKAVARWLMD